MTALQDSYEAARYRWPFVWDFVTERIALGSAIRGEEDLDKLADAGITHIIDLWELWNDADFGDKRFTVLWVPQEDDHAPRVHVPKAIAFAFEALAQPKAKIYIHCHAGHSRAPGMAYALLRAMGITRDEAKNMVLKRHPGGPHGKSVMTPMYVQNADEYLWGTDPGQPQPKPVAISPADDASLLRFVSERQPGLIDKFNHWRDGGK